MKKMHRLFSISATFILMMGGLAGCGFLNGCTARGEESEKLARMDILQARPAGAQPAPGSEEVEHGCHDDAGGWLYANQSYSFDGDRRQVLDFYREFAQKKGFPSDDEGGGGVPFGDACFSTEVAGMPVLIRVGFELPGEPEPADYTINAESALDGERIRC